MVVYLDEVESTNLHARELSAAGADSVAVCARTQRNGYGRRGNKWISPVGGLYLSCAMHKPVDKLSPLLSLAASYAVLTVLTPLSKAPLSLKWPNDLMIDDAKLGGVMVESQTNGAQTALLFGIGVNGRSDPDDHSIDQRTTSLYKRNKTLPSFDELLCLMSHAIFKTINLACENPELVLAGVTPLMRTLGKEITITNADKSIFGTALALNHDGALIVRDESGAQQVVYDGHLRYGIIN